MVAADGEVNMRTYWMYQVLGWMAYSAVGIVINMANGGDFRSLVVSHIFFILGSIGLTHLFRREIQKRRARHPSGARMWLFLCSGVVLISLIQTGLVIFTSLAFEPAPSGAWPLYAIVALEWGMLLATGVWTGLYFRFTEKRRQEEHEAQVQLALREAELRALESQTNPHFLFNCLNSIRALVIIDPPRAQDMLTRLANVLRHSLRHDRQHTVPLASEMEVVSDYLALEALRFEERLRVRIDIDPAVAHCNIPPMLLQTLVENTGQLSGAPANPNQLGLANTRERLHLLYGNGASLSLQHGDGRVTATVLLPSLS